MPGPEDILTFFCHQLAERSPHAGSLVFPVCYRCGGLYLGMFSSFAAILAGNRWRAAFPKPAATVFLAIMIIPYLTDGWANTLQLWNSPAWLRAATAIPAGLVIPYLLVPLLNPLMSDKSSAQGIAVIEKVWNLTLPACLALALGIIFTGEMNSSQFYVLKFAALTGIAVFYACMILVGFQITLNFFKESFYTRITDNITWK